MRTHTQVFDQAAFLYQKLQRFMMERYEVDAPLASEMALDFLEVIVAIDGNMETFEKYFLH